MKWIGQQIYDLASRFRNDVFLEDISTGTIASGAHLGLDSNNKIVKAVDGGGDLTSIIAGTGLDGANLTGPIPRLDVGASQTQITSVGIIGTGEWRGTAIASSYIADDAVTEDKLANALLAEIDANTAKVTNSDQSKADINALDITELGTISSGVWNGDAIASAYLDSDTAHLTTDQTFTGNKTFDETIIGSINGSAATVATIAGLAPNTATTQATQPAIESIGTDGDTLVILADELHMSNTTADAPIIKLINTTNDDQTSQLIFEKLRADDAVAVGQNIGEIWFRGQDAAQNTQNYGFVLGEIDVSTSGQESGKVSLGIANHDGGNGRGLILTGGSENDEVDATIGLGANSVTTVAGDLVVTSDLTVSGDTVTFESANADDPIVTIKNTSNAANDMASLNFVKIRGNSGTAAIGDNLAEIYFTGEDASGNTQEYARVLSEIDVATHGQESGRLKLGVANHDGGNGYGLTMQGGSANDEVDVTVALGTASVTTVAGTLTMGSTAAMTNAGLLSVANQSNITGVGTISSGVWNGTAIASANLDADTMHYSAQRQLTHHTIQDDIDTQVVFLSLTDFDAENTTIGNNKLPLIAPVAGKLLKVFVRCSHNLSGVDFTWKLYTRTSSQSTNGNAAEIGAQTGTGPTNGNMVTYDFTTGLDSGTNAIGAGDKVQISLETNGSTSNANFFITLMWEWNLS